MQNLRSFKDAGRLRYVGAAALAEQQHDDLEFLMKNEAMDFVRVDYSLENREAARRVLPLASDRGLAVLVRSPFGRDGRLMASARRRALPEWAQEIGCATWEQLFLKYVLSHPAVTCVVPSVRSSGEVLNYFKAAQGPLPDASTRLRMEQWIHTI
jgi:aryl-alcohol dehydrogenase-like predicted oxidoreductase